MVVIAMYVLVSRDTIPSHAVVQCYIHVYHMILLSMNSIMQSDLLHITYPIYAILAISIATLFVVVPIIILILYPCQFFQKFLSLSFPSTDTFSMPLSTHFKALTRMGQNQENSIVACFHQLFY